MMPYELDEKKAKELEDNQKKPYPKIANTFIENVIANSNENALKIVWYLSLNIRKSIVSEDKKLSTYQFQEKDIVKETGLDIRTIMKYLKYMMKTTITFVNEEKDVEEYIQLIPRIKNNHNGTIDYDIYNSVAKLIIDVADKTSGTYVNVRRLLKLQNKHSIRLLPLLERILTNNKGVEKKRKCDLKYLNSLFGTKYKRYSQLIKFVLEPIKQELDNNSSLTFSFVTTRETLGKRGKPPITSITLIPVTNNNYQSTIFTNFDDITETKTNGTNTLEKQKAHTEASRERKAKLSLKEEVEVYEEIKKEIDIEMFFATNKIEDEQTKDYYLEKQTQYIEDYIQNNRNYPDHFKSFMRYIEIARQNNWNF